jgi:hypothetical protein
MRRPESVNIVVVLAVIAFLNVLLLARMELSYVMVLAAVLLVAASYAKPGILILLFLIATSTVTDYHHFPKISVSSVDLYFTDILLLLSFLIIVLKYDVRSVTRRMKNPMTYALLVFLALVVVAIFADGQSSGGNLTKAIASGRIPIYYLLYFPVIAFIDDEKKLMWFLKALVVLLILVSIYILFTAVAGKTIIHQWMKTAIAKKSIMAVDTGEDGMVLRKGRLRDIPGISFVIIVLPVILGMIVYGWRRSSLMFYYTALFLGMIVVVLNFTRTVWVSYIVMALVMWFMIKGRGYRYVKVAMASGLFVVIITVMLMLVPKYSNSGIVTFMGKRLMSFFVENVNTPTAVQRIVETKAALEEIEKHFFTGIGISAETDRKKITQNDTVYVISHMSYIHNSYLNIIFKIGIFPFIAYMIVCIVFLKRSYLLFRRTDRAYVKGLSIGLFLSFLRVMINAISQHYFWYMEAIAPLSILFGLNEVLIELDRKRTFREATTTSVAKSDRRALTAVR